MHWVPNQDGLASNTIIYSGKELHKANNFVSYIYIYQPIYSKYLYIYVGMDTHLLS